MRTAMLACCLISMPAALAAQQAVVTITCQGSPVGREDVLLGVLLPDMLDPCPNDPDCDGIDGQLTNLDSLIIQAMFLIGIPGPVR